MQGDPSTPKIRGEDEGGDADPRPLPFRAVDGDRGAEREKVTGDAVADAGCGARHQGDFAGQRGHRS
jgi:hypothetical protein